MNNYGQLVSDISGLLDQARRAVARSTNGILTAAYWEIGRRIVEPEQNGKDRAEYGKALLQRLAKDLTARYGRGFSMPGLYRMRIFYLGWQIFSTPSRKLEMRVICSTPSSKSNRSKRQTVFSKSSSALVPVLGPAASSQVLASMFPLSWSQYVHLMSVENSRARAFYEEESIRGGWSVRQLDRQIGTQFYERVVNSKQPEAFLARARQPQPQDAVSVEEQVRDPYLLEFLNLKDEYSESELEEALIRHMEWFLLELGAGFTFVARQKRIRVGDSWYRIDLLLYHRRLRCLVVIDLKAGDFAPADAGQMSLYLNYVRKHLKMPGETNPVGIILCSGKNEAVVEYAMGDVRARVFASKYLTNLPDQEVLRKEIVATQRVLEGRRKGVE